MFLITICCNLKILSTRRCKMCSHLYTYILTYLKTFIECSEGSFVVYGNTAALPVYRLLIYHSSRQHTAPQGHFLAILQCNSQCRNGKTTTATYCKADAIDYERFFRHTRKVSQSIHGIGICVWVSSCLPQFPVKLDVWGCVCIQ